MNRLCKRAAIVGTAMALSAPASAAIVSRTFIFSGTNFAYAQPNVVSPYQTVSGSYSIRFDDGLNYINESNGIVLHSLNLPISPASLVFSYSNSGPKFLTVGGAQNGSGLQLGTTDFVHLINDPGGTNPFSAFILYSAPGYSFSAFVTTQTGFSFIESARVPEPTMWAMLIAGFGLVGWTLRPKKSLRKSGGVLGIPQVHTPQPN
jgi:PEP-CTERM motif